MKRCVIKILFLVFSGFVVAGEETRRELAEWIEAIHRVDREGQGNAGASKVWQPMAQAPASALPDLLEAMDNGNELAINWLRAAVDAITERELKAGGRLPVARLGEFLLNPRHHPRARRLAFELIARVEPSAGEKLIPGMLNDPSVELRRDAVQRLIDQAKQLSDARNEFGSGLLYRQSLGFARDVDQIEEIASRLRKSGQEVDLPRHFGFLMQWKVIGPFDNTGGAGFQRLFPPETEINLAGTYQGKSDSVRWIDLASTNDFGLVDINKSCGTSKGVTAYACAEFVSETSRPAEMRLGCKNAWKIWLNGKLLFGRDEYHRGMEIDQYRMAIQLEAGTNKILVKICQNEQTEDWTKEWEFQLRVCDSTGTAILSADRPPSPGGKVMKTNTAKSIGNR